MAVQNQKSSNNQRRGMKLMPQKLRDKIPSLYAEDGKEGRTIVYAKFFTPSSNWTWYVTEAVAILEDDSEVSLKELDGRAFVDVRFFGLVDGHARELGYFSLRELESVRGPFGLPIERDLYWEEVPLKGV